MWKFDIPVVVVCHNLVSFNGGINSVLMTLGETILDQTAEREWLLAGNVGTLIRTLLSTSDLGVVKVLLEEDVRVVVHLSSLNGETVLQTSLMTVVESVLARILLHAWVAAIEGKVCGGGHFDG